jgi:hypothetical protein
VARDRDAAWMLSTAAPVAATRRMRAALAAVLGPHMKALGFRGSASAGYRRLGARGVDCLRVQFHHGRFRLDAGQVPPRRSLTARTFKQDWTMYANPSLKARPSLKRASLAGKGPCCWQDWFVFERARSADGFAKVAKAARLAVEGVGEAFWGGPTQTEVDRGSALAAIKRSARSATPGELAKLLKAAGCSVLESCELARGLSVPARLALLQAILTRKPPAKADVDERGAYVQAANDASVLASKLGNWPLALKVIDAHLVFSREMPGFGHTAACALAKAGRHSEAVVHVQRALDAKYYDAARMERDRDLDAIRHSDAFKKAYARWRSQ